MINNLKKYGFDMMCVDTENKFMDFFNSKNGLTLTTGVIEDGVETNNNPFKRWYPALLDVGIMGSCVSASKGLCAAAGIQCYQNAVGHIGRENMTLANFEKICKESSGKAYQFALGGSGDPNHHENFKEIIDTCRKYKIVPNYTTSGIDLTDEQVEISKQCGAVAVSEYRSDWTNRAVKMFVEAGVKTNIHYVLSNKTIDQAIEIVKTGKYYDGINAVVFLLHKPVGLGQQDGVLQFNDPKVNEFFKLVDLNVSELPFQIGFDACTVPAIVNKTINIPMDVVDTCEGGRFSAYVTPDMKLLPCSFDNDKQVYAVSILDDSIESAWNSDKFNTWRDKLNNSCGGCENRANCLGGCPITREIVLCDSEFKDQK